MTHPLTDDTIQYVKKLGCHDLGTWIYTENDLRAAADWQLEQVIDWLKDNMRKYVYQDYYGADEQQEVFKALEYLKLAMRPTQEALPND